MVMGHNCSPINFNVLILFLLLCVKQKEWIETSSGNITYSRRGCESESDDGYCADDFCSDVASITKCKYCCQVDTCNIGTTTKIHVNLSIYIVMVWFFHQVYSKN